jgi:hypothetical protein
MHLTAGESRFLAVLLREQNQTGCRGPAHELLRLHAYPDAPAQGPGSLAFAYEIVPLTSILLLDLTNLEEIDDFARHGERISDPQWPWSGSSEYRRRLEEARREGAARRQLVH